MSPRTGAISKAVIPAAGLGTRFLPATKATPKEMLPVVDEPAIQLRGRCVEKPERSAAPSNLAVIGRYVLDPAVFGALRRTGPGRGGEILLTDALNRLDTVHGVVFKGRRYDTGDRAEYLRAIVRLAGERADLGPDFRPWPRGFVAEECG
nr:hypothetical protein [Streptomyces violascens]